jgi:hypothetical protein
VEFVQQLLGALSKRAWAAAAPAASNAPPRGTAECSGGAPAAQGALSSIHGGAQPAGSGTAFSASNAGVAGILRRQEAAQRELGQSVDEAFTDLSALMDKARDMLAFAERVRASAQRDSGEVSAELEVSTAAHALPCCALSCLYAEPQHHSRACSAWASRAQ